MRRWCWSMRCARPGFTVDEQTMDWGTLLQRRAKKEGWSMFAVYSNGADMSSPLTHFYASANCADYPGWSCDERITPLLKAFAQATTLERAPADRGARSRRSTTSGAVGDVGPVHRPGRLPHAADRADPVELSDVLGGGQEREVGLPWCFARSLLAAPREAHGGAGTGDIRAKKKVSAQRKMRSSGVRGETGSGASRGAA